MTYDEEEGVFIIVGDGVVCTVDDGVVVPLLPVNGDGTPFTPSLILLPVTSLVLM